MKQEITDLHVHSNCSDGTCTPEELVRYAHEKGLKAFALTDHDSVDGLEAALKAAEGLDLEVVCGIEFSTGYLGKDVHIVGLDIRYDDPEFRGKMEEFRRTRDGRNEKLIRKMQQDGIAISEERLKEMFGEPVITRAHFAGFMMREGYADSLREAFDRYFAEDCIYYVPREKLTPQEVVRLIASTGGIPVLAHPLLYHFTDEQMEELILSLKEEGLIGIEAIYSTHTREDEEKVRRWAERFSLEISGGSDFHGSHKPGLDLASGYGSLCVPYEVLENLRRRKDHG